MKAESAGQGQGATFTVRLPVPAVLPEPQRTALPEGGRAAVRLDGVTVLLVEDAADARELIALLLRERGAEVGTASNAARGDGAAEGGAAGRAGVGHRPAGRGRARAAEAGAGWAEARDQWMPAIALTAYAGAEDARRAYRAGFQVHMAKPLEPTALVEAVARLAGAEMAPSASFGREACPC